MKIGRAESEIDNREKEDFEKKSAEAKSFEKFAKKKGGQLVETVFPEDEDKEKEE